MPHRRVEDEIKFKDLLKHPERLFGWSYIYFFGIALIIGIFYVKNLDTISFNTLQKSYLDSLNVERENQQKKGGILPAVDLNTALEPSQALIDKGKQLYDANCQSCHGAAGNGDGPAGVALNLPPRNFHTEEGWTNGRTFFDMYKTLQEGIIQNGMAAYEYMPPEDRIAIIHYVRTFADFPEINKDELATMLDQTYNLAAGTEMPNQIPIKRAKTIIEKEFQSGLPSDIYGTVNTSNSEGAQIIKKFAYDPVKFVESIKRDGLQDNTEEFANNIVLTPEDYGFKVGIKSLSKKEWNSLFTYAKSVQ